MVQLGTIAVIKVMDDLIHRGQTYHPNLNEAFQIYTDASNYAMGAMLMQNNLPIRFWSKTLNSAQQNCTVTEKECLAMVEFLSHNRSLLLGRRRT